MITLKCDTCQKNFERSEADHNRNLRRNTKSFFCSLPCNPHGSDEFTPFRYLMGNVRKGRAPLIDLDEVFLKNLYEKQQGRCAITNLQMVLKTGTTVGEKLPAQCSVDRIDNNRDYSKDNVRLTCLIANISRNVFSDEDVFEFCKGVAREKMDDLEIMQLMQEKVINKAHETFTIII